MPTCLLVFAPIQVYIERVEYFRSWWNVMDLLLLLCVSIVGWLMLLDSRDAEWIHPIASLSLILVRAAGQ